MYGTFGIPAFTIELDGYDGNFYPSEEHIIESALRQLPVNLYASEIADNPKAEYDPSVGAPEIMYNHTKDVIEEGDSYRVSVDVTAPLGYLTMENVTLYYAVSRESDFNGYAPQEIRKGKFKMSYKLTIGLVISIAVLSPCFAGPPHVGLLTILPTPLVKCADDIYIVI